MADFNARAPGCDNDCEGERGKRGKRGHRGHNGHDGHDGHDGATGPTGPDGLNAASPDRTLFVAQSWSAPVDPTRYFTSIAAAYAASAALLPTVANPVEILVYPGTYPDPITIVSNVHLVGTGQQRAVNVTGLVTFTPGVGVNAPQAIGEERLNVAFMTFAGGFTINSTGKPAGQFVAPLFRGVIIASALTYTGRPGGVDDAFFFFASVVGAPVTFTDIGNVNFLSVQKGNVTLAGATGLRSTGGSQLGVLTLNQTGNCRYSGEVISGAVVVGVGSLLNTFAGCGMSSTLTVPVGGAADVRMSNIPAANLVGPGTINRTAHTQSFTTTIAGANPLVFAVPFPDANYNVSLQLTAGPGNAAATVTGKLGAGFTINDVIGNTYDVTVTHA
jgi:hypothetical protein